MPFAQELDVALTALRSPHLVAGVLGGLAGLGVARLLRGPGVVGVLLGVAAVTWWPLAAGEGGGGTVDLGPVKVAGGQLGWVAALGLAVMALSGAVADRTARSADAEVAVRVLVGGVGGALMAWDAFSGFPRVVALAVVVWAAAGLPLPPSSSAGRRDTLLLLATLVGTWANVPDVEGSLLAVGACLVLLAVADPWDGAPHVPTALLVLAATGAVGRPAALAGVLGAVGMLWWPGRWRGRTWVVAVVHVVVVVVCSRVAGPQQAWLPALGIAALTVGVGLLVARRTA